MYSVYYYYYFILDERGSNNIFLFKYEKIFKMAEKLYNKMKLLFVLTSGFIHYQNQELPYWINVFSSMSLTSTSMVEKLENSLQSTKCAG